MYEGRMNFEDAQSAGSGNDLLGFREEFPGEAASCEKWLQPLCFFSDDKLTRNLDLIAKWGKYGAKSENGKK